MRVSPSGIRVAVAAIPTFVLTFLAACEPFHSDNANFQRQWERDRKRRVAAMKDATAQTDKGSALAGSQLVTALTGTTHVFVYGSSPLGRKGRYVEYASFDPGGKFLFRNSDGTDRGGITGSWRVDGPRLCIVNPYLSPEESCYTLARTPAGMIQYYVDRPGSDSHGLLTKITDGIEPSANHNN